MTFQLRHEWTIGAEVNGAQLATCDNCQTLRVTLERSAPLSRRHRRVRRAFVLAIVRAAQVRGRPRVLVSHFIRRAEDDSARVRRRSPPCITPTSTFRAPGEGRLAGRRGTAPV